MSISEKLRGAIRGGGAVPRPVTDITNHRFGCWVVLGQTDRRTAQDVIYWLCRCHCGAEREVARDTLIKGTSTSCGCQRQHVVKHGAAKRNRHTRPYRIWKNIRRRCLTPTNPDWKNYGGRGIVICDEWSEFEPFRDWALAHGYADDLTIDRVNNDGPYAPNNCRWATRKQQTEHRRARKPSRSAADVR